MTLITGIVKSVEVCTRDAFAPSRYSRSEQYEVYLNIHLIVDGENYYITTPSVGKRVASAPGIAIVVYLIDGAAKTWMTEEGESGVATPGVKNSNYIKPLVSEGQEIRVNGRVQAKTSRSGKVYHKVTHAKLMN